MKDLFRGKLLAGFSICALAGVGQDAIAQDDVLEEITVTGIRGSLRSAIGAKRGSDKIIDAISSEDIGKFPDQNMADSLQRITGVSITRSDGEGSQVSVRGLPPELTKVTINGQSVSSSTGGREFDFSVISSDLAGGIEVIKSPTADLDEGGIGGTVNITTPKPLDIGELKVVASLKANYDDLSEGTTPNGSILFSNVFGQQEQFGFIASLSYQERELRNDQFTINWGDPSNSFDLTDYDPVDGIVDGIDIDGLPIGPISARNAAMVLALQDRRRVGLNAGFQWRPNDNLDLYVNGTYSDQDVQITQTSSPHRLFRSRTRQGNFAVSNSQQNSNLVVISGDLNDPSLRLNFNYNDTSTETFALTTGGSWFNDDETWKISSDLNFTSGEQLQPVRYFTAFEVRTPLSFDLNGGSGNPESLVVNPALDVLDGSLIPFDRFQGSPENVKDDEYSLQLDFERSFDANTLRTIKFGVKYKDRENEVLATREQIRGLTVDLGAMQSAFPVDNFLAGFGGISNTWAFSDPRLVRNAVIAANGSDPVFDVEPLSSGDVTEKSSAAYILTTFGSDTSNVPYSANLGVRFVRTELLTNGSQTQGNGFISATVENDYDDVLPNFNISFDLRDDLLLRFAAASVMTRPTLSDIRLSREINEARLQATQTKPDLDPFRADQYDLALEWYFADAALLSATVFYKDVESFITTSFEPGVDLGLDVTSPGNPGVPDGINDLFDVTSAVNGGGATLNGLELSYQQHFDNLPGAWNGLGAILNYTLTDSSTNLFNRLTGERLPLPGQSENTVNAILYYENFGFSTRLSYNYRDEFVAVPDGSVSLPEYTRSLGQIDFSMGYDVNENLSLSLEVVNLNNEEVIGYLSDPSVFRSYEETGTRYFFGIRYQL